MTVVEKWQSRSPLLYLALTLIPILIFFRLGLLFVILVIFLTTIPYKRNKEFLKDWWLFSLLITLYEYLRGYADNLFFSNSEIVNNIETKLFGYNLTIFLQKILPPERFPKNLMLLFSLFYSSFFWMWGVIALFFWFKSKDTFKKFTMSLLVLNYISLVIFILIPTSPPWYLESIHKIKGIERVLLTNSTYFNLKPLLFFDPNPFAALPSLHFAWSFLISLFLIKYIKKIGYVSLIYPGIVGFFVIYAGEHYLIDIFLGGILVVVSMKVAELLVNKSNLASTKNGGPEGT